MNRRESYNTLGLPVGASEDDIKKAYHKLAMEWHPDRNKSPEAEDKIKKINEAYDVLTKTSPNPFDGIFGFNVNSFNFKWSRSSSITLDLNDPSDVQRIIDIIRMNGIKIKGYRIENRG
jgi:curved DNA-binding protein CbpA